MRESDRSSAMPRSPLGHAWLRAYTWCARGGHRLPAAVLGRLRRLVVRWYDPDLRIDLFARPLVLPFSHDLPFTRAEHPGYSDNLRRVVDVLATEHDGLTMVDIGANVGDSVALVHREDVSFICVEGHPDYVSYLRRNTADIEAVTLVEAMVGTPGQRLRLDAARGSATATEDVSGGATRSLAEIVETEAGGRRVDLVKVDTDGHDADILTSSIGWIREARPSLFFEYDPNLQPEGARPVRKVVHDLVEIGYRWLLVWDKVGDLLVAVESDDVMDELDRYVTRAPDRYFDICMVDDENRFARIRAAEQRHEVGS